MMTGLTVLNDPGYMYFACDLMATWKDMEALDVTCMKTEQKSSVPFDPKFYAALCKAFFLLKHWV